VQAVLNTRHTAAHGSDDGFIIGHYTIHHEQQQQQKQQ